MKRINLSHIVSDPSHGGDDLIRIGVSSDVAACAGDPTRNQGVAPFQEPFEDRTYVTSARK